METPPAVSTPPVILLRGTLELEEQVYKAIPALTMIDNMPQIEIPDEKDQRFCVLSYEQVKRLNDLMSADISIYGRGNFPTIEVRLCELVSVVRKRLESDGVKVKEIRLNGSGASSVLAEDSAQISYNDLDLIFSVDLSTGKAYDRVKCAVLDSLMDLLPKEVSRKRMSSCSMKEAYVSKMVKVNDSDRWSLITLGNNRTNSVELKFVHHMRRQYEFSVDSFHILLDTLFLYYDCAKMEISENFYPTVVGESMFGNFHEALCHLHNKQIATRNPEEIRGGGLLKYCNLLCKGYKPAQPEQVKNMERYMCSRFFIDFPDIHQQQAKLENYLYCHFQSSEDRLKHDYLMILHQVVNESTVCLMGHERRLTLSLIEDMAYQHSFTLSEHHQQYHHHQYPQYVTMEHHPHHHHHSNNNNHHHSNHISSNHHNNSNPSSSASSVIDDPNLLSPMSMSDASSTISSASSTGSSSGYTTPQKPDTPGPLPNTSQPPPPTNMIPTYEIVTSCQPAVVYSNGYYYTSFMSPPQGHPGQTHTTTVTSTTSPCIACATCNQWVSNSMMVHPTEQASS
ncbi:hypothetical protein TCAL_00139 [Tigriopus californicus]|uniref:polynucleotide adenylyltransferase n=1 Tax=Tigriopus californicus TaxID=6832 RepID=A0A553PFW0_TIGCA|nr:hypothetical protein TCAL_00139 [Tigriopus californicus]